MTNTDANTLGLSPANLKPATTASFKIVALIAAELALFGVIAGTFWYQDLRFSLPTPKPANWQATPTGQTARLPATLASTQDLRPLALNFYNCDCPCSRFNLDHVRHLAKEYGSKVRFMVVLEGGTQSEQHETFRSLHIDAEPVYDSGGTVARHLGVYATPQGVILDSKRHIVYRGNYNVGRFCTDPRTEFVRIALDSTVSGQPLPATMTKLPPAYGCAIPAVAK